MQDQVAIERLEQLQLKEEQHQRDLAEEKIFADLWEADRQAKVTYVDKIITIHRLR